LSWCLVEMNHLFKGGKANQELSPWLQGDIDVPSLWVDEAEAASGTAALRVAFRLGDGPQTCRLPFKAVKLQPMKRGGSDASLPAYKAFISAKLHLQLYRLVHLLFPTLGRWDQELRRGDVLFASSQQNQDSGASNVDAVRAMPVEQVSLWHFLTLHSPRISLIWCFLF